MVETRLGGTRASYAFDELGRVTNIKLPYREAVPYTWNAWGLPATLGTGTLFMDRGETEWTLSAEQARRCRTIALRLV